jgi:PAS domain S-box-containing protein
LRKPSQKTLRASASFIRLVLDSLDDHVAVLDERGTIVAVNGAWEEFAVQNGAADASSVSVGANYLKVCRQAMNAGNQIAEQALEGIESVLSGTQRHCALDYECSSPLQERWFKMTILRQKKPGAGVVITHSDITDRKRSEQALRRSEERLRLLIDALPVLVSYVDENQCYLFHNKGYEDWFGYRAGYVEGKHLKKVLGEKAYQALRPRVEAALSGQLAMFEDFIPYGRAGRRYVRIAYVPDRQNGSVRGFFALIQDLTEHKQAEEQLRESRDRLSMIITGADVGTWDWNIQAGTVDVNDRFCTMLGYGPGTFGNDVRRFFDSLHPDDVKKVNQLVDAHFAGESEFYRCEFRLRTVDGAYKWIHDAGRLIERDREGRPLRMVGIHADINDRKLAEEALQSHRQALRNLAAELSLTQEKERRQIADDLHDHIGQNLVLAKMKLGELKSLLPPQHSASIEQVRTVLDQSIKDTRSMIYDLCPQVLYELGLEAAIDWLVEQTQTKYGLRCVAEIKPLQRPIREDRRVILFQAIRELLVNVAKHARATQAKVIFQGDGVRVRIQVADDGRGFDPSLLTFPESTGKGFGLFSIRERLALLGGALKIDSVPGQGTTATVTMPA